MQDDRFAEMNRRVFEERSFKLKANPVILQAIREKEHIKIEEELIDGRQGLDWQRNHLEVEDSSVELIEAIFNRNPLHYGDQEDYDYSLMALQPYSLTMDEVVEIFALTDGLIICGHETLHRLYDMVKKYDFMLREKQTWDVHASADEEIKEDLQKMQELIDWLRPVCQKVTGNWRGEGILSRLFKNAAVMVGVKEDLDSDDIVIAKKMPYRHVSEPTDTRVGGLGTMEDWIK